MGVRIGGLLVGLGGLMRVSDTFPLFWVEKVKRRWRTQPLSFSNKGRRADAMLYME